MEKLYQIIIKGIEEGNYNILEEIAIQNPNDKKILYYSCLLYEQKREYKIDSKKKNLHKAQWKREITNTGGGGYLRLLDDCKKVDYAQENYLGLHIECTTYCCAKCTTCTHGQMIADGSRKTLNVSYEDACYRIRKMKLMFLLMGGEGKKVLVDPVGLGEPLCHPQMIEIIEYMALFFGNKAVWISTNAFLLNEEISKKLIQLNLAEIVLSLSYFDKEIYENQIGMNYDKVIKNITYFMNKKKVSKCTTKVTIHIFDNALNTEVARKGFREYFSPMLKNCDILDIRPFLDCTNIGISSSVKMKKKVNPCGYLWYQLVVDCEGNILPCCMSIWKKTDPYLLLGRIEDYIPNIFKKGIKLRLRQLHGDYQTCRNCLNLYRNDCTEIKLSPRNKNIKRLICGYRE